MRLCDRSIDIGVQEEICWASTKARQQNSWRASYRATGTTGEQVTRLQISG